MSVTSDKNPASNEVKPDLIGVTIDGIAVSVPKNTLVIRAAEEAGIEIPRFCDHPLLEPVGACRQCLVEVATPDREGNVKPMPKPQASCTMTVSEGMQVRTQHSSPVADKAQQGIMEMLLINHPLDCPVCDKGGECPLQNQSMSHGRATSRFDDIKRTYPKPINISSQVLLDRDRCVLCARCTRFSDQIAGDPFIALVERGALQQVGIYEDQPFESYFSGNTVQICPVGALTGAAYRFRSRPFDLVSTPDVCEHCADGCAIRTDHRRGTVLRRMAGNDPQVNEEWNCDKGRWAFNHASLGDRFEFPMVRDVGGELRVVSWQEALTAAAEGLRAARGHGVLVGGRVSVEDAYAYATFARSVLRTEHVDHRARPHSADERDFLLRHVAGTTPETGVTYDEIGAAGSVLLVGLEPEEESPILFLRLRKAYREAKTTIHSIAPLATRGLDKLGGTLIPSAPGTETEVLTALTGEVGPGSDTDPITTAHAALRGERPIILVGERLATVPGALPAAAELARATGARLAWIPRRAGERGAVEAGCLPGEGALDTAGIVAGAASGQLGALVVGGVDAHDLGLPGASEAFERSFVVSLEIRPSSVTEHADVVLPVAPHAERAGAFVNWEGRVRPFEAALSTNALPDHRVLHMLADEMGEFLGTRTAAEARSSLEATTPPAAKGYPPRVRRAPVPEPGTGELVLATWRLMLDEATMQEGEPFLAGTAKAPRAHVSPATALAFGLAEGDLVTVLGDDVRVTVPVVIQDMVDHVVWLPTNSSSCDLRSLAGRAGAIVSVTKGGAA
ncbi:NADH-quinone oxidoreductase subunit G [Janibacter sp. Soil728]|uniref:NADH-quinone oxidoreductase subunit G n=1 Tax=Janibacter sp. Soil728 TaxID=1736393 RepID=UPI0006F2C086|nr:NADH-quinone oxidoreductase subunit G [Janibacter sp. Soil728]KRE35932.1 NADH-quinone oxidoreductase subunit G [Janibacter sp. Soil728]